MPYYIRIDRINGRKDFCNLAEMLSVRGYSDRVEYFQGGWVDNLVELAAPHLKFTSEDDAIAYSLTNGTTYSTAIPVEV